MSVLKQHDRSRLLSSYIDHALTDAERQQVEILLASDAGAREELEQLRRLTSLLGSQGRIEPDIGFWTRLSVRFEEERREARDLLPFPRKYLPASAAVLTLVVALLGVVVMKNRGPVIAYFSKQTAAVRTVYEQGILKGSVLPLFASIDKDRALQFSLFGELALDDRSKTALRVDEKSNSGYRIEVGKGSKRGARPVSYDRFVAEVQPTAVQRHVIDSLLGLAQDRIASSVLVGEDNTFAIDPELPRLNRVMVAGIASCLEAPQRRRMERLLAEHDAPYAVSAERAAPPQEVMARFGPGERPNRFMIITPDTTMFTEVRIDFDSLQRTVVRNMQRFQRRQQEMFNRMQAGEFRWISRPGALPAPSAVPVDSDYFRVDFAPPVPDLPSEMHVMVTPRGQMEETTREFDNGQVHIRIFESHMKAPHAPQPPRARANRDTTRSVLTPQERPD